MPDYWASCGYRLLRTGADGRLVVTDDFLRSFLQRPELAPVADSCAAERAIADALVRQPGAAIEPGALAAIRDDDARYNYEVFLRFRARLVAAPSLEAAYVEMFSGGGVDVPPDFVRQLTQVLLRHALGSNADPIAVRVAEALFRTQRITITGERAVMAADEATIERFATPGAFGSLGELLARNSTPTRSVDLDVLDRENAPMYWERDEQHDLAISLNRGQPALDALCAVLSRWVAHFLDVDVTITPRREIDERAWVWHVGLDVESTALLNDLYNGADVDEARLARLLCLFELRFADPSAMRAAIAGRPVYLAMAMDADQRLKLKPQNLLFNLPLARLQ